MTMTNNITEHTGKLTILRHLPVSSNGHPRYITKVGSAVFITADGNSHSYSVINNENRYVTVTICMHHGKRTLNALAEHTRPKAPPADERESGN